ncbi:MAG: zinc ABC transporter substrate-binding protein [Clostridia bacterium]|nr:zinc ABC transporter substrate-binding protein [Clostridia bacterium]
MKKIISVLLALAMLIGVTGALASCDVGGDSDKLSIVTTIFPQYDWVKQIMGEKAETADITMLLGTGVDLHNYQPTAANIIKISECDMFIYVGGESDGWVDDILANAANKDMIVINLLKVLGEDIVKQEEIVDGMEHEDDHKHEDEQHEHTLSNDEHVWLSLKNAKLICTHIAEKLGYIDPDNIDTYNTNLSDYLEKLTLLDGEYQAAVEAGTKNTLLFGDRFPFRYLVDDYNLEYYAAFSGCSSESEASFETIAFLAGKLDELNLSVVLTIDGVNHKIAETVISNTTTKNARILSMNSMQSNTTVDIENGVTYLSLMEANLDVLKQALK